MIIQVWDQIKALYRYLGTGKFTFYDFLNMYLPRKMK